MNVLLSRGEKLTGLVGRSMIFLGTSIFVPETNWKDVSGNPHIYNDPNSYVVLKLHNEELLVYSSHMNIYDEDICVARKAEFEHEDMFKFLHLLATIANV